MKNHIVFKFIAIFLCAAMLALSIGCGAALNVLVENDLFDGSIDELRQTRQESACFDMAEYLAGKYALENLSNCSEELLWQIGAYGNLESLIYNTYAILFEDGQWYYTLEDARGNILAHSQTIQEAAHTFETKISYRYPILVMEEPMEVVDHAPQEPLYFDEQGEAVYPTEMPFETAPTLDVPEYEYTSVYFNYETQTEQVAYLRRGITPEYTVTLYLTDKAFSIYEAADWHLLELAQQYRYHLIGGLLAGLILFVALLVYLCCAAGRCPGSDEIAPQGFNRLPLDLYAAGGVLSIIGLVALLAGGVRALDNSGSGESYLPQVVLIGGSVMVICVVIVAFLFACAAQMKLPGVYWIKHTAAAFLCVCGWKLLKLFWSTLVKVCRWSYTHIPPLVKKTALGIWNLTTLILGKLFSLAKALWKFVTENLRKLGRRILRLYSRLPLIWQWLCVGFVLLIVMTLALISQNPLMLLLGLSVNIAAILYGANCFGSLMESARKMSKGDLHTKISDPSLIGSFQDFAADLNALADVAVVAAEKQMKSERMKAELVTNVSHDIKTPLTSIINYVDLMKNTESQEEAQAYLEVLERQSLRLKKLIEDLMEMSKASTGNMAVNMDSVDAVEAINQALGEFADKLSAAQLTPIFNPSGEPVRMRADGRLAWRVLSNLLSNAVKYALPGTRLYVDLVTLEGQVLISLKNISREQLNVSSEELTERFVRGDASRNTEGSGLGLNIAKSLMELQGGQLQLLVDGDLFKATMIFREDK